MPRIDELRLIARVARMYLLNRSREEGIIRISVNLPKGVYTELEETLVKKFGLRDVIVVDSLDDNESLIQRDLGAAAAYYLEAAIRPNEVIGISSWSATLLALVDALHTVPRKPGVKVVQILGGVGNPSVEAHATRLTSRMAQRHAIFLWQMKLPSRQSGCLIKSRLRWQVLELLTPHLCWHKAVIFSPPRNWNYYATKRL